MFLFKNVISQELGILLVNVIYFNNANNFLQNQYFVFVKKNLNEWTI